jgi:uncharacterized lipoprotein NlpE involved in copper resistance
MKICLFLIIFVFVGCNNEASSPEGLVKMFVSDSVKGNVDRDYYEEYTTGSLLAASRDLSDEEIDESSLDGIKSIKTKIISKNCGKDKCILTYIVTYLTSKNGKGGSGNDFSTEVKKIAEVEKEGDIWKIAQVKNVKTYHESLKPINPLKNE